MAHDTISRRLVAATAALLVAALAAGHADARGGGGGGGFRGGGGRGGGGARSSASRGSVRYSRPASSAPRASAPASRPSAPAAGRPANRPATRPSGGAPSRVAGPVSRPGAGARSTGGLADRGLAGRGHSLGTRVDTLPAGSREISHGGGRYGYLGGRFYRHGDGAWTACRPPLGCHLPALPPGSLRYWWGARWYWYWGIGGCYYWHDDDSDDYVIVEAPEGAIVAELPEGAVKEVINGKTYWRDGDTLYKPVYGTGGELMYQVVKL